MASKPIALDAADAAPRDEVHYPDDDIVAVKTLDGTRKFTRKDGTPY